MVMSGDDVMLVISVTNPVFSYGPVSVIEKYNQTVNRQLDKNRAIAFERPHFEVKVQPNGCGATPHRHSLRPVCEGHPHSWQHQEPIVFRLHRKQKAVKRCHQWQGHPHGQSQERALWSGSNGALSGQVSPPERTVNRAIISMS